MAKLGKLITDVSVNGSVVCVQFECSDEAAAQTLYNALCDGVKRGQIELTHDGVESIEEISVQ